jgi:hypothetical protein
MSFLLYPGPSLVLYTVLTVMPISAITLLSHYVLPTILYFLLVILLCIPIRLTYVHVYLSCTPAYPCLHILPYCHTVIRYFTLRLSTRTSNPLLFLLTIAYLAYCLTCIFYCTPAHTLSCYTYLLSYPYTLLHYLLSTYACLQPILYLYVLSHFYMSI